MSGTSEIRGGVEPGTPPSEDVILIQGQDEKDAAAAAAAAASTVSLDDGANFGEFEGSASVLDSEQDLSNPEIDTGANDQAKTLLMHRESVDDLLKEENVGSLQKWVVALVRRAIKDSTHERKKQKKKYIEPSETLLGQHSNDIELDVYGLVDMEDGGTTGYQTRVGMTELISTELGSMIIDSTTGEKELPDKAIYNIARDLVAKAFDVIGSGRLLGPDNEHFGESVLKLLQFDYDETQEEAQRT